MYSQENGEQELLESLEEGPPENSADKDTRQTVTRAEVQRIDGPWSVLYLKANYRHYYRLSFSYTNDQYEIPFNLKLQEKNNEVFFSNTYSSDSKIYLSQELFSYIRFDYSFNQSYDTDSTVYQNKPEVQLYEAYLNYQSDRHWLQIGGLQMRLGKVDMDSPIDVLHLKNAKKVNHMDRENAKYIMPTVKYNVQGKDHSWSFYWGPFQRVSEEKQSLRANLGVQYQSVSQTMDIGFALFHWFDSDNAIVPEFEWDPDSSSDVMQFRMEDTSLNFATMDVDVPIGKYVFKADFGCFSKKNFYHVRQWRPQDATEDTMEMETLGLNHFAFAVSLERKLDRFFLMPVYSYRRIFDVPSYTHIVQYENRREPSTVTRDLERHQIGAFMSLTWRNNLDLDFLFFYSFPYQRVGVSCEALWKPSGGKSRWRFLASRVETAENKMTHKRTILNHLQYGYSIQF